jgi:hypothetical protein
LRGGGARGQSREQKAGRGKQNLAASGAGVDREGLHLGHLENFGEDWGEVGAEARIGLRAPRPFATETGPATG